MANLRIVGSQIVDVDEPKSFAGKILEELSGWGAMAPSSIRNDDWRIERCSSRAELLQAIRAAGHKVNET